jgi:hypothetical protein
MTTHEYLLQKYGTTLSFQQASGEIGLHWQTIRGMCLRGEIKTARAGHKWILTTKALASYLDDMAIEKTVIESVEKRKNYKWVSTG